MSLEYFVDLIRKNHIYVIIIGAILIMAIIGFLAEKTKFTDKEKEKIKNKKQKNKELQESFNEPEDKSILDISSNFENENHNADNNLNINSLEPNIYIALPENDIDSEDNMNSVDVIAEDVSTLSIPPDSNSTIENLIEPYIKSDLIEAVEPYNTILESTEVDSNISILNNIKPINENIEPNITPENEPQLLTEEEHKIEISDEEDNITLKPIKLSPILEENLIARLTPVEEDIIPVNLEQETILSKPVFSNKEPVEDTETIEENLTTDEPGNVYTDFQIEDPTEEAKIQAYYQTLEPVEKIDEIGSSSGKEAIIDSNDETKDLELEIQIEKKTDNLQQEEIKEEIKNYTDNLETKIKQPIKKNNSEEIIDEYEVPNEYEEDLGSESEDIDVWKF